MTALTIRNHRLVGAGVTYVQANAMGGIIAPSLIVMHDTAGRLDKGSSVGWFRSRDCKTSAHVVIERDGSIVQMVPFNRKAFHAGESVWHGRRYCNGFSIGVEIVSPGRLDRDGGAWFGQAVPTDAPLEYAATSEHGSGYWLSYTPAQIDAVKRLSRALMSAYPDVNDIATHWQISPGRKIDTGPLFPLAEVTAYASGEADPEGADTATPAEMVSAAGSATGTDRPPPATMAQSTTGHAALGIGGGGTINLAAEMSGAVTLVAASGQGFTLMTFAVALAQSPTFWVSIGSIALAAYIWLERRAKLVRYGI
jgi:N-acetylmuramoyl-L-alanine amidase